MCESESAVCISLVHSFIHLDKQSNLVQCCYISQWAHHRQCQHFSTNKLNRSSLPPFMPQKCTEWLENQDQNPNSVCACICDCMFSPCLRGFHLGPVYPHNPHDMHRWTGDPKLPKSTVSAIIQRTSSFMNGWILFFSFDTVNFCLNEKYIKPHGYWLNVNILAVCLLAKQLLWYWNWRYGNNVCRTTFVLQEELEVQRLKHTVELVYHSSK